jgi:uncharacterized repeat protein (TIGR03803 family)
MSKLSLWRTICFVSIVSVVEAIGSPAQTFKTLVTFNGTAGQHPNGPLVQGRDGNFYGTTTAGGSAYPYGVVFKITPGGKLTALYSFCPHPLPCPDGASPRAGLVLATNGNFYGTTSLGGAYCGRYGCGTFFEITPVGKASTLHSFDYKDRPSDGALVQATDGNFYGTSGGGGTTGRGTVFKITAAGKLTRLYSFCSQANCPDGAFPGGLVQATDGNFYGVTGYGGTYSSGTVFKITAGGALTTLYSFCAQSGCPDGAGPLGLAQATNGNFYGTTGGGGANSADCSSLGGCGTVFEMTPVGKLTTLHSFDGTDGVGSGGLVQATSGNFYGTTYLGGANGSMCLGSLGCGTVFKITAGGALTTLYSFCAQSGCPDGSEPEGLVQATNGKFYGTTYNGGAVAFCPAQDCGTVFSLSVGLGPFVETLPNSDKVGRAVTILGNNLTGTSSVTFNGTAATFTVVSGTEIKTTVPVGATTGFVKVTTPKKTIKSNVVFRVTK